LSFHLLSAFLLRVLDPAEPRDERGDVPGWVMVTIMSAGLVVLIWGVAGDELADMLRNALQSVSG